MEKNLNHRPSGYSSPMKKPFKTQITQERHSDNDFHLSKKNRWSITKSPLDLRMILGFMLIIGALISAYIISQSTTRMVTIWSATNDLAPGEIVEESDVTTSKVALSNHAGMYLDGGQSIIGTHVLRSAKTSELIPAFSIAQEADSGLQVVPISLSVLRIPDGVSGGSIVDIYGVPRNSASLVNSELNQSDSKLLLSQISVDSINRDSSRLGGDIGLSILVPMQQVATFIKNYSEFDFVLVKHQ